MFTLSDNQIALLLAARAWREEGERRFDFWSRRAALQGAADAFMRTLDDSGLRAGRPLAPETRDRLLRLASELAPNPHLSRRLYAADPAGFDTRLRALFYGDAPLETRLAEFIQVRGTGALTGSQLLCAFDPRSFPLITRAALRRLRLSPAQKRAALGDAAGRYGFTAGVSTTPAQSLLALFVVYEAVRDALRAATYPQVDDLLRAEWGLLPGLAHIPPSPSSAEGIPTNDALREPSVSYDVSPMPVLTETALLAAAEEHALAQGFTFPPHLLRSYYVALKTRPFAILSGVSGTGKTRLTELLAEWITGYAPAQFTLIPVRPDWADSAPLFGYHNILAGRYVSTPFLDMARAAGRPENRTRTYFVCLDEMNLARVEYYLADYLSALESRAHRVPLHEGVPDLILPPNLFVTGTVNVDETTHAFSRKVLDRANTLDFDDAPVFLTSTGAGVKGAGLAASEEAITPVERQALFLGSRLGGVGRARERLSQIDPAFPVLALDALQSLNDRLYPHRLHFAYRVRDDVLSFLAHSFDAQTGQGLLLPDAAGNFALALDLQVCQKVLPRLSGLSEALDPVLAALRAWAEAWPLPRAAARLARMQAHGAATGFVRFHE